MAISLAASLVAGAQTWPPGRTTPGLRELVAVDRSGEAGWIFGSEDVAGDGSGSFGVVERAVDVRSAYVSLRSPQLALRVYVASNATPGNLRVYAFIDVDRDTASGGSASAPEIDAALAMDPASGNAEGYELVIGMLQGPRLANVWRWQSTSDEYEPVANLDELELVIEAGTDLDPLEIGDPPNGYLQATLDPGPLGVPPSCAVDFLFRASDGLGNGDLDVGDQGPCRPTDADRNGVADIAEAEASCTDDAQCPAGGSCVEGSCRTPEVVLAPGENVRGGAFACSSTDERGSAAASYWLAGLALLIGALRRRPPRSGGYE